jgi:hypothetical protein
MHTGYRPFRHTLYLTIFLLFCCSTFLLPVSSSAQEQFAWARSMKGQFFIDALTTDRDGSVYIAGHYTGSFVLGDSSITRDENYGGVVIAKFDTTGSSTPVWLRRLDGASTNRISSISLDTLGYVYIAGKYSMILYSDTTTILSNPNDPGHVVFTARYDTSGRLDRIRNMNIHLYDLTPPVMATDPSGNLYLAGSFRGDVALNDRDTLYNSGKAGEVGADIYLIKYDASDSLAWHRSAGGKHNQYIEKIAIDRTGTIYVAGTTKDSLVLSPTLPVVVYGIFVASYTPDGTPQWIASTDSGYGYVATITGLATDSQGNAFVSGEYYGPMKFGTRLLSSIEPNCYIAAYNSLGHNTWATDFERGEGMVSIEKPAISCDSRGNVWATATLRGNITVDNIPLNARHEYAQDILIAKYNPQGKVIRASRITTQHRSSCIPTAITVDTAGQLYLAGMMSDSLSFGNLTAYGDTFLARTSTFRQVNSEIQVDVFPNPGAGTFTVRATEIPGSSVELTVYDLLGKPVFSQFYNTDESMFVRQFSLPQLPSGVYVMRLRSETQTHDTLVTVR